MTALLDITRPEEAAKDAKARAGAASSLAMRCCMEREVFPPCVLGVWPPCRCGQWVGTMGFQPGGYDAAKPVICYLCAKRGLNSNGDLHLNF